MAITTPRTRGLYKVAAVWQASEGSAGTLADARAFICTQCQVDPGRVYIDPQGTFGTRFIRDTHREVAKAPSARLELHGAIEAMPLLLESACMGQSTVSNSQLTEANDGSNFVSNWSLTGVRPGFNTAWSALGSAILYVKITDENPGAGQALVQLYKDAGLSSLVAQGSGNNSSTVTLSAQNNSGLSGTVDLATVTANDTDITLTINTVTIVFAAQPARFFTLWVDTGTGGESERLVDCVVRSLTFSSRDQEALSVSVDITAKSYTLGSTGSMPSVDHMSVYSHHDCVFRTDADGTPVTESPTEVSFGIQNDIMSPFGSATTAAKHILKGVNLPFQSTHVMSDEAKVLIDTYGDDDAWVDADIKYTLSSKVLAFTWTRLKPINPQIPEFSGLEVAPVRLEWAARENNVASPAAALAITYQP